MGSSFSATEAEAMLQEAQAGNEQSVLLALRKHPELLGYRKRLLTTKSVWHVAAQTGNKTCLQAMVAFALSDASPFAELPPARRALKLQAILNVENYKGHTPLLIACLYGQSEAAAVLVTAGADIFIGDRLAETGLHHAARHGHADCIRAVIDNASPAQSRRLHYSLQDAPSMSALVPLHFAVAYNHLNCVETLLRHDAYLLARTKFFSSDLGIPLPAGSSPLHVAAQLGYMHLARTILKHQTSRLASGSSLADARWARNSDGYTAYQIACRRAQPDSEEVEVLNPLTDLEAVFGLQELATPGTGVVKLSVLAAASLQSKLLVDIRRASNAEFSRASAGEVLDKAAPSYRIPGAEQAGQQFQRRTIGAASVGSPPRKRSLTPSGSRRENGLRPAGNDVTGGVLSTVVDASSEGDSLPRTSSRCTEPAASSSTPAAADAPATAAGLEAADEEDGGPLQLPSCADEELERVLSGELCALCFERAPDVGVSGCEHKLCSQCAETLCSRVTSKPLPCPFCRRTIKGFYGSSV